jgi:hypothetical protein
MMNRCPPHWAIVMAAMLMPVHSYAQTVASSFADLPTVLKPGQTIVVTDAAGHRTKGKFVGMRLDSLVLSVPGERTFAERDVLKVKRSDPIWNGAVIGGLIIGGLCARVCGQGLDSRNRLLPVIAVNAGFGALIGAAMDALDRPKTLYIRNAGSARGVGGHE